MNKIKKIIILIINLLVIQLNNYNFSINIINHTQLLKKNKTYKTNKIFEHILLIGFISLLIGFLLYGCLYTKYKYNNSINLLDPDSAKIINDNQDSNLILQNKSNHDNNSIDLLDPYSAKIIDDNLDSNVILQNKSNHDNNPMDLLVTYTTKIIHNDPNSNIISKNKSNNDYDFNRNICRHRYTYVCKLNNFIYFLLKHKII
jgi:hypothetical protein